MTDAILSFCPELAPALEAGRSFYESLCFQGARPLLLQIGRPGDGRHYHTLSIVQDGWNVHGIGRASSEARIRFVSRHLDSHDASAFEALNDALMQVDLRTWKIAWIRFTPCLDIVRARREPGIVYTETSRVAGKGAYARSRLVANLLPALRPMGDALAPGGSRPLFFEEEILPLASGHERMAAEESLAELGSKREKLKDAVSISYGKGLWLRRDGHIAVLAARQGFNGDEHEILGAIDLRESP